MRVKAYLLEDNKYNPRGKGNLKIIRFKISFFYDSSLALHETMKMKQNIKLF